MTLLRHRVRYHEADAQGIMFNSRYLEVADVAMVEYVRSIGWPYAALADVGVDPAVRHAEIEFRAPAHFDDVLDVDVSCLRVGRTSFTLASLVTRDRVTLASITIVYVNLDPDSRRPRALPPEVSAALHAPSEHSS